MGQPRKLEYNINDVIQNTEQLSDVYEEDNGSYESIDNSTSLVSGVESLVNTGVLRVNNNEVVLKPDISSLDVSHNLIFTSVDATTVAWEAGTIIFADGSSYLIEAGDTGVMGAKTIIYLDTSLSVTELQVTTSPSSAVGLKKVIIATAENSSNGNATFQVSTGIGGLGIGAEQMFVDNLAAIVADLGAIIAGTITLDSSGHIKGGQTTYDTGVGFFLGLQGGTHKFSIGNSTGSKILWDGNTLSIAGDLSPSQLLNLPPYTVATLPDPAIADGALSPTGFI